VFAPAGGATVYRHRTRKSNTTATIRAKITKDFTSFVIFVSFETFVVVVV
jgi:hypothetical protein